MAASVLFACGLNEQKLPHSVHISEESNVDGSFLVSCILGQRLRISNAGTLLVCLQHNYQHYFNAGMRLGYNSNIFLGKTLNVIDPLNDIAIESTASKWLTDERQVTASLLADINQQLESNYKNRISTTIIIDNLAILMNLGATKEELLQLAFELSHLPKRYENLTVITKMGNCDIYELIDNNVAKLADVRIRVVKLKSGAFRDVDGKLWIDRDVEGKSKYRIEQNHKEILYKVSDRNVKIFNPGEIGVKV